MWYVIKRKSRYILGVYPVPTRERADRLAHCMGGYWRCKGVAVTGGADGIPLSPNGQPPASAWEAYPGFKPDRDMVTVYNQGFNAGTADRPSEAEGFYCSLKAIAWRPGLPRCA